jgi:peptide deformylase
VNKTRIKRSPAKKIHSNKLTCGVTRLILPDMTIRSIVLIPDPVLRRIAQAFERADDETRRLLDDMLDTMYAAPGIGLAAPQVGVSMRALVMDVSRGEEMPSPLRMINPEIVHVSDAMSMHDEGCLSIPEVYAEVERPASCLVRYVDYDGKSVELQCEGLLATCVQHEVDHLNGILFIDHLSRLRRDLLVKKFHKSRRENSAIA